MSSPRPWREREAFLDEQCEFRNAGEGVPQSIRINKNNKQKSFKNPELPYKTDKTERGNRQ